MAKVATSLVSVFTVDEVSMVCVSNQFTLTVGTETVDSTCLNDVWMSEIVTGKNWSLSVQGQVNTEVFGTKTIIDNPICVVAITTGAGTYAGAGILKTASHTGQRRADQTESFELTGTGALVYTAPA